MQHIPVFRIFVVEQVDGLHGIIIGGGALGIDQYQNQVGDTGLRLL